MDRPEVVRPLGPFEQYSSARHSLRLYRCLAVTCRYSVPPPSSPLGAETPLGADLEKAVARVVLRLGALQVGIDGEATAKPCFVQVPSLDLRDHIEWQTTNISSLGNEDDRLLRSLERQHNQPWPDLHRRPPWKLIVIPTGTPGSLDIVFALHHSIGDGKSALVFHTHLLEALNHPKDTDPALTDHVLHVEQLPFLAPPQEALVNFTISWWFLFAMLWREFAPSWLRRSPAVLPWTGQPIHFDPVDTHLRLVVISPGTTKDLLSACRANGVTLTPLLHALTCAALARRLPSESAPCFAATTPISLRPFATLPAGSGVDLSTSMANLVTAQTLQFTPQMLAELRASQAGSQDTCNGKDDSSIWWLAATLRSEMQKRVESLPRDDIIGMLAWVSNWHDWVQKHQGKPKAATWEVSNVGTMRGMSNQGQGLGWKVHRTLFTQSANVVGPVLAVNVSGVAGGGVTLSVAWQQGIVEPSLAEGLVGDLQQAFAEFARTGEFAILVGGIATKMGSNDLLMDAVYTAGILTAMQHPNLVRTLLRFLWLKSKPSWVIAVELVMGASCFQYHFQVASNGPNFVLLPFLIAPFGVCLTVLSGPALGKIDHGGPECSLPDSHHNEVGGMDVVVYHLGVGYAVNDILGSVDDALPAIRVGLPGHVFEEESVKMLDQDGRDVEQEMVRVPGTGGPRAEPCRAQKLRNPVAL